MTTVPIPTTKPNGSLALRAWLAIRTTSRPATTATDAVKTWVASTRHQSIQAQPVHPTISYVGHVGGNETMSELLSHAGWETFSFIAWRLLFLCTVGVYVILFLVARRGWLEERDEIEREEQRRERRPPHID